MKYQFRLFSAFIGMWMLVSCGGEGSTSSVLAAQNISFAAAPSVIVGGTGTVSATGGASGNAVTFSSTTPDICTITGGIVRGVTLGTCVIAADQAGTASYLPATQATQNVTVTAAIPAAFGLRGFNLSAFETNSWNVTADNAAALQFIKDEGGNAVALDWMVEFADNGTMSSNGGSQHPSWADITDVMTQAKALGLYVILKPHVISTTCCGQNRNSSNTSTTTFLPANFFPAWKAYLLDMNSKLPMTSADALAIGTEMDFIDWQFRTDWASLIQSVRGVYSGAITYDSMFSQYLGSKNMGDVVFWDLVDFISCSFYVRLTTDDAASVATLKELMRNNPNVGIVDAVGYLKQISSQYGKQVFTLEGGYQSANGALWGVNDSYGSAATENQDLQSRGLNAYLYALNVDKGTWLKGVSLWDLQPRYLRSATWTDPNYINGWGMYNKTSANTVKSWFTIP